MTLPAALRSFAAYGIAIVIMKGASLFTIPLVTANLDPAAYGELDIAVSIIEFTALICTFGLSEILFRFGSAATDTGRKDLAALSGTMLVAAALASVAIQIAAGPVHDAFGLAVAEPVFRLSIAAAGLTAFVELPLAHLRMRDKAGAFLGFVVARTVGQIALMWILLKAGYGVEGVLGGSAVMHFVIAAVLTRLLLSQTGIGFSASMARNMFAYGLPLVASGLCMFALGTADRWFLNEAVSRETLAHYAIAGKFALATSLILQPFGMWWYPRRLTVLANRDGIAANRTAWRTGLAILAAGGVMLHLALPVLIELVLPAAYLPALVYLPWLIAIVALNELVSLSNAGAYLGRNTLSVLGVNAAAAVLVLTLYALLIPHHGLWGAIGATLVAQFFRLSAFATLSRKNAPVPVISLGAVAIVAAALIPALVIPAGANLALTAAAIAAVPLLAALALLAGEGWRIGFAPREQVHV